MEGSQRVGLGGGWREALPLLGISLILGTPQVLALPAPFASDGLSLALSSLLPVVSLAGLFGASVAAAKGGGGCRERLVACAGLAATAIYLALSWWVVLSWSWGAGVASLGVAATFVLDVMGMAAAGIGMFGCCYMACDGGTEARAASPASACRVPVCALAAAGMLGVAGRFLPNWTMMRIAASFSGPDGRLFAESLSLGSLEAARGLCPLAAGIPFASALALVPSLAWAVLVTVLRARPRTMVRGICSGLFAAWALCALFQELGRALVWSAAVLALLLALAGSLLAVSCRSHRLGAAKGDGGEPASSLTGVLSPRESEALHLRLDGLSSSEAAGKMGVSASTVRNLQARALDKLGVGSLDELRASGASDLGTCGLKPASLGVAVPLLLAVLIGAVLVAFSRTQKTWADAVSETMVLGISLSLCSLLRGAGWDERVPLVWYEFGACAFVGFLAGLVPLVSLAAALLALLVMVGERGGEHLDSFFGLFVAFGLGVCVGGYASGLLPRLPALLALASNNEGAMLLAVLTGVVAGALCLVGVTSCVLALRSVSDHFATPAEEADGGQGIRRFSAYLVSKGLNPTEMDVTRLVLQGLTSPEIASRLNLSRGAVNSARRGAYRKLGIHSRTELAEECRKFLD